jgi:hypothetical protein
MLGAYRLGQQIWDLSALSLNWGLQSGGPQAGGLQAWATNLGSLDALIELGWGPTGWKPTGWGPTGLGNQSGVSRHTH